MNTWQCCDDQRDSPFCPQCGAKRPEEPPERFPGIRQIMRDTASALAYQQERPGSHFSIFINESQASELHSLICERNAFRQSLERLVVSAGGFSVGQYSEGYKRFCAELSASKSLLNSCPL